MKAMRTRLAKDRQGAVMVEFAIVAPLVFLVIFTMFEFSRMNVIRHTADNAAYEAARMVMVPGASADDAVAEANRILAVVGARGSDVSVTPSVIERSTREVTVEVEVPMSRNALVAPHFTGESSIHSRATLRTERVESR